MRVGVLMSLVIFSSATFAQNGDFNGDSLYDCHDIELLQGAFDSGDMQFDLTEDAMVDDRDLDVWLQSTSAILGYEVLFNDVDLDGDVDRRDFNTMASNHFVRIGADVQVSGWCRGEFGGDGIVDSIDRNEIGLRWQMGVDSSPETANVETPALPSPMEAWTGEGVVFARTDQFDLVAVPHQAPNGFVAATVAARVHDSNHEFVSIDNLRIAGDLHQVWLSGPFGEPTAKGAPIAGTRYHQEWIPFDSHILITKNSAGSGAGGAYDGISETNDGSDPSGQGDELPPLSVFPPKLGMGGISMENMTDIFMVWQDRPINELALAYVVTPVFAAGQPGHVNITVGLQGANEDNLSLPDVGIIRAADIPFFSLPCDYNLDGTCQLDELNALVGAIKDNDPQYNLDANPDVNTDDVDVWLSFASDDLMFVVGDTNLDGDVDAADLNNLALHWQIPGDYSWSGGDFDGNGVADSADLNMIGLNWRHGTSQTAAAVPEPHSCWLMLTIVCLSIRGRRHSLPKFFTPRRD